MPFTKMQGLGNDFILLDNRKGIYKNPEKLSKRMCNRRFGIGADQLLLLVNSGRADFRMRIFNADGSEVEMCGNGIRCLAKYIWDNKLGTGSSLAIETDAGIIRPEKSGELIKVNMGEPVLEPEKIPVNLGAGVRGQGLDSKSSLVKNFPIKIDGKTFKITCVSMGNPHAVIVVKDVNSIPLETFGPLIENHRFFPKRTNVEFIHITDRKNIKMRVWERGAGETLACGTGASAAAVASSLLGLTDRRVNVHLKGGKLLINWSSKDGHVYMTGPAVKVFEGNFQI
ncbi:MAG: diaminopimelate epimerase [Nitrospirae bacterium]|nr:diaminopimelate epimerase [Nitrospirota bacterium]